jgi:hypothetical protein
MGRCLTLNISIQFSACSPVSDVFSAGTTSDMRFLASIFVKIYYILWKQKPYHVGGRGRVMKSEREGA